MIAEEQVEGAAYLDVIDSLEGHVHVGEYVPEREFFQFLRRVAVGAAAGEAVEDTGLGRFWYVV